MGPTKGPQENETNHGALSKTAESQHPQGGRECGRPGGADKIRKESGCPTDIRTGRSCTVCGAGHQDRQWRTWEQNDKIADCGNGAGFYHNSGICELSAEPAAK